MDDTLEQKIEEYLNSSEFRDFCKKKDNERLTHERFNNRMKSMPVEKQDEFIRKVIEKYASDAYKNRWWNRGIFPPNYLFDYVADFIYENGTEIGKTEDGNPIYQYNHWRVDGIYGQGQVHYNFEFVES